jgi:hypothetical protein
MIRFNAALVGAYWERLLVRLLGRQRVAGREPRSERRSEGQPEYSGESQVHHLRHPAPISATQPTDLLLTDIRATHNRAMDMGAIRDTPHTPVPRPMDTQVIGYPAYSGPPGYGYQSRPLYSPYSSSDYRYPVAGYSGDRPSENWSPGVEYAIEPAS